MKKYNLELVVFICGMVVMILEIDGSRILAPYLGTSLFVWTSLIGILLGSLSLGYWLGGKIADKNPSFKKLSVIILLSGILISLIAIIKDPILQLIEATFQDIRLGSIIGSVILFTPSSIFLGMVSPYALRLKLDDIDHSGRTAGNLYALSTIGSILGTFLAGFILLTYFGNTKLLIILAITLVIASLITIGGKAKNHLLLIGLFFLQLFAAHLDENRLSQAGIVNVDTDYNHVQIYKTSDYQTKKPILLLDLGRADHSAIFLSSDDLVFEYTKYYRLAELFKPAAKSALAIGGGAYSYPKDFLKNFPNATLDVVELDPGLTALAKEYFHLKDSPNLNIFHEDGRTFLNKNTKKYDLFFGDAFRSFYSIPYQLTTIEAVQKISDSLSDDGIALINVISSIEGEKGKFFRAEYATYKKVFPQVYTFPVNYPDKPAETQNIILIAFKSTKTPSFSTYNLEFDSYLNHLYKKDIPADTPILTDDFAPVDQYIMDLL